MTRQIVFVLIGFVFLLCSGLLVSSGLESLAHASTDPAPQGAPESEFLAHQVKAGESLYRIAENYYGDPARWQAIAIANGISTPTQLKAGQILTIPFPANVQSTPAPTSTPVEPKADTFSDPILARVTLSAPACAEHVSATLRGRPDCYALTIEKEQGASREIFYHGLFDRDEGEFRFAFAEDRDFDGNDELYTVWDVNGEVHVSRVMSVVGSRFAFTEALYNDPLTIGHRWLISTHD